MLPSGGHLAFEELPLVTDSSSHELILPVGRSCSTAWISDVHLGTRASNVGALLQFLRDYDCDKLYVVGDLIDIWQLRRGFFSPQQQNDVIQKNPAESAQRSARYLHTGQSRRARQ